MIFGHWPGILSVSGLGTALRSARRGPRQGTMRSLLDRRDFLPMNYDSLPFKLVLVVALVLAPAALRSQSMARLNGDRLMEHLSAMAGIGKDPGGGYSRVAYSEADRQGREYVTGLMRAAGLTVSSDAA